MKKSTLLTVILFFITAFTFSQQNVQSDTVRLGSFRKMQLQVELDKSLVKPAVLNAILDTAILLARQGKLDTQEVIRVHQRCREHAFVALNANKLSKEEVKEAFSYLDKSITIYFGCDQLQDYYRFFLKQDSANPERMLSVINSLDRNHCLGCDLYMKVAKRLFDLDSTPENALLLGRYFMTKNGYGFAYPLMHRAERSSIPEVSAEANLAVASMYRFFNRFSEARDYALKAIRLNPADAMPYVIIGDCYAWSADFCGTDSLGIEASWWAAMDKYEKAISLDTGLKETIALRLFLASSQFPKKEILIMNKLTEGDQYKIDCWIRETTHVRARKTEN